MIFTVVFCVDELVECIKVRGGSAVDVVPPVADKVLLVENGSVGAQDYKNKNWSASSPTRVFLSLDSQLSAFPFGAHMWKTWQLPSTSP